MSPLAGWCLLLIVSCASGEVVPGSCTGDNCAAADSTMLLQSGVGVAHSDREEAPDDKGGSGSGDSELDCSTFTRGSTCKRNGCAWSGAFVGEKKADGSELTGYICADDEEVEEEVHDKLMNGTGSLIQILDDESEITNCAGGGCPYCRRRRRGRSGGCPYCRRRRSPPAKVESNGCPTGYAVKPPPTKCPGNGKCCKAGWSHACPESCATTRCTSTGGSWVPLDYNSNPYTCEMPDLSAKIESNGCPTGYSVKPPPTKCPGNGKCCKAGWSHACPKSCATTRCTSAGGSWVPLDYNSNPYTCEMPDLSPMPDSKPMPANKYCDEPNGDNAGFDCLCAAGTGFCGLANTWHGTLDAAKTKCDGNSECMYLHDWKADGSNWRACRTITSPGDGKAAIKKKGQDGKCSTLFDRIDINNNDIISVEELNAAFDAGKIEVPEAVKIFDRIDVDNDNGITSGELNKGIDAGKVTVNAAR